MKKYLVIGNPIEHSLSPKLHNYWLDKNKIDGNYDKKLLTERKIGEFLKSNQNISGINVTVPFKKTVLNYCTELTELASSSQSVNTIVLSNDKIIGDNILSCTVPSSILIFLFIGDLPIVLGVGK